MSKKQKTMRFPALLLVLCLVTGALVTDKILHLTKTDENRIVVAGEDGQQSESDDFEKAIQRRTEDVGILHRQ